MTALIIKGVLFLALLAAAAVRDMKKREIPDLIPLAMLPVGCIGITLHSLPSALLGAAVTALPYLIAAVAVKRGGFSIGGGDIKLMAGCGFVLGVWGGIVQSIIALTAVVIIGAVVAVIKKKKYREVQIPLAPCFGMGGILAYLAVFAAAI
mgnify:CR=1 FL=1